MDALLQIITVAFLAFGGLTLSILYTKKKRHIIGLLAGVIELIMGVLASCVWAEALRVSGKTDWFVLGLFGYTPIALIFYAILLVGVLHIGVNLRHIIYNGIRNKPAAEA